MKEITSYASNYLALYNHGKLEPQAEIALVLCEPQYRLTSDGSLARERAVETVRFSASPDTLRELAERFTKTADEAEAELKAAILENDGSQRRSPAAGVDNTKTANG